MPTGSGFCGQHRDSAASLLRYHPAWQPRQAAIAAEGGGDQRSAQGADAPLNSRVKRSLRRGRTTPPRVYRICARADAVCSCSCRRWCRDCSLFAHFQVVCGTYDDRG